MIKCRSIFRWLLVGMVFVSSFASVVRAEGTSESLGSQLLDDLDPHQFSPPAPTATPAPVGNRPRTPKRILPGVTDDDRGAGEPSAGGPLVEVKRNMDAAESLLRGPETGDQAGRVQQQVVADLDALIEQLSKQCNCSGSSQSNGPPKPGSQRSQAASSKPASRPGRGAAPARDSTARLERGDSQAVQLADREELLKNLWGHLPPHVREQMLQSHSDEFLPQYELEIEAYFQALAEEDAQ